MPQEYWDSVRKGLNRKRCLRHRSTKKAKNAALKEAQDALLSHLSPEEKEAYYEEQSQTNSKLHQEKEARFFQALEHGVKVAVDCSFACQLDHKGIRSLCKQIELCCGINRRADSPVALTLTSFTGAVVRHYNAMKSPNWKVKRHEQATLDVFPAEKVVMLSPDAAEPLLDMQPDLIYVIGGIVDRSVQRGLTLNYARDRGIAVRRLPIAEHTESVGIPVGASKSPVLNVSDVVAALLEFNASSDWGKALQLAIPARKKRNPNFKKPSTWAARPLA